MVTVETDSSPSEDNLLIHHLLISGDLLGVEQLVTGRLLEGGRKDGQETVHQSDP